MQNKKGREAKGGVKYDDQFLEANVVTSATECTGLIPALPETEAEAEAYEELCAIPKPQVDKKPG